MKNLLALLTLGGALIAAEAPQTHRVDNLGNCYRLNPDGSEINLGQPADAIANNPGEASGIQRAALKLLADFQAKLAADTKAAQDAAAAQGKAAEDAASARAKAAEDNAAAQIAAAQKASADAIAANAAELDTAKRSAEAATYASVSLGGKVALLESKVSELEAALAAKSAELETTKAALDAKTAELAAEKAKAAPAPGTP